MLRYACIAHFVIYYNIFLCYAINPLLCNLVYCVNCSEDLYIDEKVGQKVLNWNNSKCFVENIRNICETQAPKGNAALSTE